MRHLRSILYALVLAPAVWVLAGVGLTRDLTARGRDDFAVESVTGLLLLVLAGAAYAILLLAPISPAGPLLGGLAFVGISAWAWASPAGYAGVWPSAVAEEGFDLSRPGYGLAALLAVPLIAVAFNGRRWARAAPARDSADPTVPMRLPMIMQSSDDTTTVLTRVPSEEPTLARTGVKAAPSSEEKTVEGTAVAAPGSDEPTVPFGRNPALSHDEPADLLPSDEPTTSVASFSVIEHRHERTPSRAPTTSTTASPSVPEVVMDPDAEVTIAVPSHRDERRTVVVVSPDEAATVAALCDGQASTKPAADPAPPAEDDEPAEAVGGRAGEEAVVVGRAKAPPRTRVVPSEFEETRSLQAADPDRTRAIDLTEVTTQLQVAPDEERTRPITVVGADDAEITRPLGASTTGEPTVTMRLLPPNLAGDPAESPGGDETQVIKLDPERTQIIRPGSVQPPGERTEIIRLPVKADDGAGTPPEGGQREIPA